MCASVPHTSAAWACRQHCARPRRGQSRAWSAEGGEGPRRPRAAHTGPRAPSWKERGRYWRGRPRTASSPPSGWPGRYATPGAPTRRRCVWPHRARTGFPAPTALSLFSYREPPLGVGARVGRRHLAHAGGDGGGDGGGCSPMGWVVAGHGEGERTRAAQSETEKKPAWVGGLRRKVGGRGVASLVTLPFRRSARTPGVSAPAQLAHP